MILNFCNRASIIKYKKEQCIFSLLNDSQFFSFFFFFFFGSFGGNAMEVHERLCCPVIQSFFPDAVTLGQYLSRFPENGQNAASIPTGSRLQTLLDTAIVADIPIANRADSLLKHANNALLVPYADNATAYPTSVTQEQVNALRNDKH